MGAMWPWAVGAPVSAAVESQRAQEPSEELLPKLQATATLELQSQRTETASRLSPAWLTSTFQLFTSMAGGGGHQQESAVGSGDSLQG